MVLVKSHLKSQNFPSNFVHLLHIYDSKVSNWRTRCSSESSLRFPQRCEWPSRNHRMRQFWACKQIDGQEASPSPSDLSVVQISDSETSLRARCSSTQLLKAFRLHGDRSCPLLSRSKHLLTLLPLAICSIDMEIEHPRFWHRQT